MRILLFFLILKSFSEDLILLDRVIGFLDKEPILQSKLSDTSPCSILKEVLKKKDIKINSDQILSLISTLKGLNPNLERVNETYFSNIATVISLRGKDLIQNLVDSDILPVLPAVAPSVQLEPSSKEKMNILIFTLNSKEELLLFMQNKFDKQISKFQNEEVNLTETELDANIWQGLSIVPKDQCSLPLFSESKILVFCVKGRTRKTSLDLVPSELQNAVKILALAYKLLKKNDVEEMCKQILPDVGFEYLS